MYTREKQRTTLVSVLLKRSVSIIRMTLVHQYPHIALPKMSKLSPMMTCNSKKLEKGEKGRKKNLEFNVWGVLFVFGLLLRLVNREPVLQQRECPQQTCEKEAV